MLGLGVDPEAEVVGVRYLGRDTLLRTRIRGRSQRYIACYDTANRFMYYREITSSERKRVVLDNLGDNPIGTLDWVLIEDKWVCQFGGKVLTSILPNRVKAPTDYSVYMWGTDIVSNSKLKDMIKSAGKV